MNAKDCERIAMVLAEARAGQNLIDAFDRIDGRIGDLTRDYLGIEERHEQVMARYEELMHARFGRNWPMIRGVKDAAGGVLEQARREIYGEAYHPSLFRK